MARRKETSRKATAKKPARKAKAVKAKPRKAAARKVVAVTAKAPSETKVLKQQSIASYGWMPDLPDGRDQMYMAPAVVNIPPSVDLSPNCPAVYDQGQLGSCTANAIGGAIQFDRMKQGIPGANTLVPSRLFIYYNERVMERSVDQDHGAQIRDGIKSVAKLGACFEGNAPDQWPYVIGKFANPPPKPCYAAAATDRALSYSRLTNTLDQLRGCLASGYPFVFGFTVYDAFESQAVAKSGVLTLPQPGEGMLGGHAVLAVGYDDASKTFLVRNSWGAGWGKKGYFTMPYAYATNTNLADDFWTIRVVQQV